MPDGDLQAEDEAPASEAEETLMGRTGFTPAERLIILQRDGMCVPHQGACGGELVIHHRANRGMGGSRAANRLSNGLTVCAQFNTDMEGDAAVAELARVRGWKISKFADPESVPVWVPFYGARMYLTDDGNYREEEP